MIVVNDKVSIPEDEIEFRMGPSSGPGGQNVNRVQTRVTAAWSVRDSPSLTEVQRERILSRLATRINKDGVLQVRSQQHRTQAMNRDAALERLGALLAEALTESPPRRPTRPSRTGKERRLEEKKRRSEVKAARARRPGRED